MRHLPIAVLIAMLASAYPGESAAAQELGPGADVRVRYCAPASEGDGCRWIRGSAVSVGRESLTVRDASGVQTPVPLTPDTRVHMLAGRRRNTAIGLVGGALAGMLFGSLAEGECSEMCGIYPLLGLGGGAFLGGAIGYMMQSDRWVEAEVPRSAAITAMPTRRAGVNIAF